MNEKVLIVEDEKGIADATAYAFRREGYRVEVVYSAQAVEQPSKGT